MPILPNWNAADGSHQARGALLTLVAEPPSSPVFTHGFCRGATFFYPTDTPETLEKYSQLMNWAYAHPTFFPGAKNEFATNADAWLIAHAAVNGLVVVTHEQYSAAVKRRLLIPNVCLEFNVEFVDTYSMLRDLGVSFSRA